MFDQIGGRGFTVRAGHAQHDHAVGWMAETVGRDLGERLPCVFHYDSRRTCGRLFAHDCRRAQLERFSDILMPIGGKAADGNEQVTRLHRARIITHFSDIQTARCGAIFYRDPAEQFLQFHILPPIGR